MKKILLVVLVTSALSGNAQSLKDLLYGGKLKSDTGTVVRKTDDLSTKIDTTTRKPVEPEKPKAAPDASIQARTNQVDSTATPGAVSTDNTTAGKEENTEVKSNNKAWKDFIDELTGTLRTEVLTSKKIKSGTYSLLIEYQIDVDGQVTANNVSSEPENSFLAQQVKDRVTLTAPKMTPLLNNFGKPRKAVKKYTLVISKS